MYIQYMPVRIVLLDSPVFSKRGLMPTQGHQSLSFIPLFDHPPSPHTHLILPDTHRAQNTQILPNSSPAAPIMSWASF